MALYVHSAIRKNCKYNKLVILVLVPTGHMPWQGRLSLVGSNMIILIRYLIAAGWLNFWNPYQVLFLHSCFDHYQYQ